MKTVLPNYNECITNVACSVLKYFDIKPKHNTTKEIDEVLEKNNPKNVVVMLFDGMGYNLINRILNEKSFLINNMIKDISSVCPSATTASTMSILTGLNPCEHGWLGWDLFVPGFNEIVTLFMNSLKTTRTLFTEYNIGEKYLGNRTIIDRINEESKYSAKIVSPFGKDHISYYSLRDMCNKVIKECNKDGKKYIYAYYENPDDTMHKRGTDAWKIKRIFRNIDKEVKRLCDKVEDTVVIVTADHGHMNMKNMNLYEDYKDFYDTLDGDTWLEGRFCAFKVKDEIKFKELFDKYFSEYFILKTKQEIIDEKFFGDGEEHKLFRDSLGDYFALAKSNKSIKYVKSTHNFLSSHAGLSEDEMRIPLVMIKR